MQNVQEQMTIRKATPEDARQIAEILVEDWKTAYRGIIDDDYLDSLNVEERHRTRPVPELNGFFPGVRKKENDRPVPQGESGSPEVL